MIKWSVLAGYIQNGVLKDAAGTKYPASDLLIWARWACSEISYHTAELAEMVYDGDGTHYQYDLPDDLIDDVEHTGLVGLDNGQCIQWLPSFRNEPNNAWYWPTTVVGAPNSGTGYLEWPTNTLTMSFVPAQGQRIVLRYFKIWDAPKNDESILYFPVWMEKPFAYYVGAAAMDPKGVQASDIRQWNDKTVQGLPEHNPLHRQAEFFIKRAESLLSKHRAQDRETFFSAARPRQ